METVETVLTTEQRFYWNQFFDLYEAWVANPTYVEKRKVHLAGRQLIEIGEPFPLSALEERISWYKLHDSEISEE